MTSNDEWLESLKPGDKVYFSGCGLNRISTVERKTPTGRIILEGSKSQFINGRHRIDDWNSEYIIELTDEIRIEHILKVKLNKINKYKLNLDEPGKINTIYDILYGKE